MEAMAEFNVVVLPGPVCAAGDVQCALADPDGTRSDIQVRVRVRVCVCVCVRARACVTLPQRQPKSRGAALGDTS